jgi:F0F1-type ATP synthase alpha subunit
VEAYEGVPVGKKESASALKEGREGKLNAHLVGNVTVVSSGQLLTNSTLHQSGKRGKDAVVVGKSQSSYIMRAGEDRETHLIGG